MAAGRTTIEAGDSGGLKLARTLPPAFTRQFSTGEVSAVRHAVRDWVRDAGLTGDQIDDFLMAVHELVINAAGHGGGHGVLILRSGRGMLVAEVTDRGPGFVAGVPETTNLPGTGDVGGRGLVLARLLSDALSLSEHPDGVTAAVMLRVPTTRTDPKRN